MSGTLQSLVDVYTASDGGNWLTSSENAWARIEPMYDALYEVLDDTSATLVASYDGAADDRRTKWSVWERPTTSDRDFPYYLLVQASSEFNFDDGSMPMATVDQDAGDSSGLIGVQVVMAVDSGGSSVSPWQGTTAGDGTDTAPKPAWAGPVGGELWILPSSNDPDATNYSSDLDDGMPALMPTDNVGTFHVLADDDHLLTVVTTEANDEVERLMYVGPYTPGPDRTEILYPLVALSGTGGVSTEPLIRPSTSYGNNDVGQGGVWTDRGVDVVSVDQPRALNTAELGGSPVPGADSDRVALAAMPVLLAESQYVGYIDPTWLAYGLGMPRTAITVDGVQMLVVSGVLSGAVDEAVQTVCRWSGQPPGYTYTPNGR